MSETEHSADLGTVRGPETRIEANRRRKYIHCKLLILLRKVENWLGWAISSYQATPAALEPLSRTRRPSEGHVQNGRRNGEIPYIVTY
jgi:hypothetical protein